MKTDHIFTLTGLRAVAAWWVVFYHFRAQINVDQHSFFYEILSKGYWAVDLFFILSGFVIYLNYEKRFPEFISFKDVLIFLVHRVARIYPLHLIMLLLFLLNPLAILYFSKAGDIGGRYDWGYYFASVILVQNWGFFDTLQWNIPAWSISTEWAGYLIFPCLLIFLRCVNRLRFILFFILVFLLITIASVFYLNGLHSLGENIAKTGLIRCILEFSLGVYACNFIRGLNSSRRYCAIAFLFILFLVCILNFFITLHDYIYIPGLFVLLVGYYFSGGSAFSYILTSKPFIVLGNISYSTYLSHYFIKDWVKFIIGTGGLWVSIFYIATVFIASVILYYYVELPGRKFMKDRLT